ncbi:hypothetical protein GGI43DRAFT_228125 [Trichoderma evansii]
MTAPQRGDEKRPLTPPGRLKTTRQLNRPQDGRAEVHDLHPSPGASSSHRPRQPSIVHRHVSGQESANFALMPKLGERGCSVAQPPVGCRLAVSDDLCFSAPQQMSVSLSRYADPLSAEAELKMLRTGYDFSQPPTAQGTVERDDYDTGYPTKKGIFAILDAVSKFVQPRQPPVPVDAFPLPASWEPRRVLFEHGLRHTKRPCAGLPDTWTPASNSPSHGSTPAHTGRSASVRRGTSRGASCFWEIPPPPPPPPPHLTLQLRPARHQPRMISVVQTTLS